MTSRVSIAALWIGILLPAGVAFSQNADRKGFFDQQRKAYREGNLQYPLMKQNRIDEVFRIRVDAGEMLIEPLLEPDREYVLRRAILDGLTEPAVILCHFTSQDLGQVEFELDVDDYSDPLTVGRLHIQGRPGGNDTGKQLEAIDITKSWQTPVGLRRVFFNQNANSASMQIYANDGGNGHMDQRFVEKDFATLRRRHHAETEQWLRPILRELHQEAVFGADPATAWQVLAPQWPVDLKMKDAIGGKIAALDNDDFRVRRRTADDLERLGRNAALVMMKMDRTGLSDEQNLRLDEVISRFKPVADSEARRLRDDPNFLLDCLYGEDPTARGLALDRLRAVTNKPLEFDLNASEDDRVKAVNAMRARLIPPETVTKP
jgi:hypothetical protein